MLSLKIKFVMGEIRYFKKAEFCRFTCVAYFDPTGLRPYRNRRQFRGQFFPILAISYTVRRRLLENIGFSWLNSVKKCCASFPVGFRFYALRWQVRLAASSRSLGRPPLGTPPKTSCQTSGLSMQK